MEVVKDGFVTSVTIAYGNTQKDLYGDTVAMEVQSLLVDHTNAVNIGGGSYPPLPTQGTTPSGNTPGKSSYANVIGESSKKAMNIRTLFTLGGIGLMLLCRWSRSELLAKDLRILFMASSWVSEWLTPLLLIMLGILGDPDVDLLKEDGGNVSVRVKLHGVPITTFNEDGLSAIATKLGTSLMLDSYTSDMCDNPRISVMAISVISISLDSSEDSVGTPAGRVILFGTIPTTIPDTTPVITPPATQTDTPELYIASPDYHLASDSESDPFEDTIIRPLPTITAYLHFLSSDDDTTDSDTPDTPPSPTHGTPFTKITASTQRSPIIPRRRVIDSSPWNNLIPHGSTVRLYPPPNRMGGTHDDCERKRVGPLTHSSSCSLRDILSHLSSLCSSLEASSGFSFGGLLSF
ncbi:hypothetical protein Tco_0381576 [Tanacetum coccineum]